MNSTPAPALERGITLLKLLTKTLSLEEIAAATGLPRSSLLRLLDTLIHCGVVKRNETNKHYSATHVLTSLPGTVNREQQIQRRLERIATATGETAEWYVMSGKGMTMLRRATPKNQEVGVTARTGFRRAFDVEFEAVCRVARAWLPTGKLPFTGMSPGGEQGKKLPAAEAKKLQKQAKEYGWAADPIPNSNGVRRCACIVTDEEGPIGILAVAEIVTLARHKKPLAVLNKLLEEAGAISSFKDYAKPIGE